MLKPLTNFERVIKGETGLDAEIKAFNKKSKAFQIKHGVDTAIIEYRPGESLDASKFIKKREPKY